MNIYICKYCKHMEKLLIALAIAALVVCVGILHVGHLLQIERNIVKELRDKK